MRLLKDIEMKLSKEVRLSKDKHRDYQFLLGKEIRILTKQFTDPNSTR